MTDQRDILRGGIRKQPIEQLSGTGIRNQLLTGDSWQITIDLLDTVSRLLGPHIRTGNQR